MYETPISCGHVFYSKDAPPVVGDVVYCARCSKYQFVYYASSHWKVRCQDCSYSRYLGADHGWARGKASKHATKYVGHRVKLFRARTPHTWEIITAQQDSLPIAESENIPF